MKVVEDGGEPMGVVRDPAKYFLMLPEPVPTGPDRDGLPGALVTSKDMRTLAYLAGFPDELAEEVDRISAERGEQVVRMREMRDAGWKVGGKNFSRTRHFAGLTRHGLDGENLGGRAG
jgi:hypothetical protein